MNRIIKTLLIFLILSLSLSCTLQIAQNNEEKNLNLNYRVAQDMIGSTLRVRLYTTDNTIITEEERSITQESNKETFTFDFLDLGSTVKIQVDILKDENILYTASKETVIKDKNVILIDTLNKLGSIIIVPSPSMDMSFYNGTTYEVTIDGNTYSKEIGKKGTNFGEKPQAVSGIEVEFGNIEFNKDHNVTTKILNSNKEALYEGKETYNPKTEEKHVVEMKKNNPYFLWAQTEDRAPINTKISYKTPDNNTILDNTISYERFLDQIQLSHNEHIVLDGTGGISILYYIKNGCDQIEIPLTNTAFGEYYKINSIAQSNNYIICAGLDETTSPRIPILFGFKMEKNPSMIDLSTSLQALKDEHIEQVQDVIVDGNTIYIAAHITPPDGNIGFRIYKSTISDATGSLKVEPFVQIISSQDYPLFRDSKSNIQIADFQVVDGKLYALAIDNTWGSTAYQDVSDKYAQNSHSRGALLIISNEGPSYNMDIRGFSETRINPKQPESYNDTEENADCIHMMRKGSSELDTCFVGPRKFIANEKGKLIFADSGAVFEGDIGNTTKSLLKRIAIYDIANDTLVFKEVNSSLFSGIITNGDHGHTYYRNGILRSVNM